MLILGHPYFESELLYKVSSFEEIKNTPSNTTILLSFKNDIIDLAQKANNSDIQLAFEVTNIKEVIFASNFNAKYILVSQELAKNAQRIANEYLFDSKILVLIQDENELEKLALDGIDGVVFPNAIRG